MYFSIVGTVGVPASYGGFETLAENLLPSANIDTIYCSKFSYQVRLKEYKGTKLIYLPLKANGFQSILYDVLSIFHALFFTKNSLLVLGVSGAIAFPLFKLFSNRKIITNIDGLEWNRGKWGDFSKKILKFLEKIAIKWSDEIISDNESISNYISETYCKKSQLIAYGGEHAIRGEISKSKDDYSLALCRIEPENNVDMILDAFSKVKDEKIK